MDTLILMTSSMMDLKKRIAIWWNEERGGREESWLFNSIADDACTDVQTRNI